MDTFSLPLSRLLIHVRHRRALDHDHGSYWTQTFGAVPRFKCLLCGKTFSLQTFSTHYYAKKKVDLAALFERHAASQSGRALGRALGLSTGSVQNRLDRLARQALSLHATLRPYATPHEAVCVDGFVPSMSLVLPQRTTFSITAESRFILDLSHGFPTPSGVLTPLQRQRAAKSMPMTSEPGGIAHTFRDLLVSPGHERPPSPSNPLVLITTTRLSTAVSSIASLCSFHDVNHRVVIIRSLATCRTW